MIHFISLYWLGRLECDLPSEVEEGDALTTGVVMSITPHGIFQSINTKGVKEARKNQELLFDTIYDLIGLKQMRTAGNPTDAF